MTTPIDQQTVPYEANTTSPSWQPTIKELPLEMRPRQRLAYAGPSAMSTAELLSLILGAGGKDENAIRMAERLLISHGGLRGLAQISYDELCAIHNVGPAKAAQVQAAIELSKRLRTTPPEEKLICRTPSDIADLVMLEMGLLEQEHLRTVLLDTRNRLQSVQTLYVGNLNSAIIRVGEVFREPIRRNAATIVLVHNHPSGDPSPSPEDVLMTKMVVEAGQLLDIELMDHLIIGRNRFVSLKERGLGFNV
ncbi:MAG: DNA repair protein RadC [Chloroflexota bacterium]